MRVGETISNFTDNESTAVKQRQKDKSIIPKSELVKRKKERKKRQHSSNITDKLGSSRSRAEQSRSTSSTSRDSSSKNVKEMQSATRNSSDCEDNGLTAQGTARRR